MASVSEARASAASLRRGSRAEIAEQLGVPLETVRSASSEASRRLRAELEATTDTARRGIVLAFARKDVAIPLPGWSPTLGCRSLGASRQPWIAVPFLARGVAPTV
jgi:hypothetical protein